MDLLEKIFEKVLNRYQRQNKNSNSHFELCKHGRYLSAIASAVFENKHAKSNQVPFLAASKDFIGLYQNTLFLPEKVDLFAQVEANKKVYLNLILLSAAASRLNLKHSPALSSISSPLALRFETLQKMRILNSYLDQEFANFHKLQNEIFDEMSSLKKTTHFHLWQANFLLRNSDSELNFSIPKTIKTNEKIPDFIFYTLPCLEFEETRNSFAFSNLTTETSAKNHYDQATTELKKKNSGVTEYVDIKKEKANPVTHSFEKLETADEYQGGYRFDSGEDQLKEHHHALDELSLSKVTRGGEAAKSVYSADGLLLTLDNSPTSPVSGLKNFSYPEWNLKTGNYLANHCLLVEQNEGPPTSLETAPHFKKKLIKTHQKEISHWKKMVASFINYPLWKNRLYDGEEFDFDSFLHDFASLKASTSANQRWYSKKWKSQQELAILILFDQSMSTDSWVQNKRVLDVIIDSVGLMGLIFDELIPHIQVAGTYSETRHHCYYKIYKEEDQPWSDYFESVDQIQAMGYTRLGPAIRHAISKLQNYKAEKKLLILITDGKPTDLDGYEGRYGVSDIKKSCTEAEISGILPFALTIDKESKEFFPKMFNHYTVLNSPEKLPQELYRLIVKLMRSLKS